METKTTDNKALSEWARQFSKEHQSSIDYFLKFGSPIEKALCETVQELAGGGHSMSPETFKKLEAPEEIRFTHEVEDCSREQIIYLCRVMGDLK